MTKLTKQLKQLPKAHYMSLAERSEMNDALKEYMELRPMPAQAMPARASLPSFWLWQHKLVAFSLLAMILLGSGAGATYAATDALPGERLYSVKILIEDMHERMLRSKEAKHLLAQQLAARRVHERAQLKRLGRLDARRIAIIEARLAQHKAHMKPLFAQNRPMAKQALPSAASPDAMPLAFSASTEMVQAVQMFDSMPNDDFAQQLFAIEADYQESAAMLKEIEQDIQNIDALIHN